MASWLRRIVQNVQPQAMGNLLRAPRRSPPPMLPPPVSATFPGYRRPGNRSPARRDDDASQSILHIRPQRRVDRQLRRLRAPGGPFSMPLSGARPIHQAAAARRGTASQFSRDRRRRTPHLPGNLPYPRALGTQDRKLLPLRKQQISPGQRLRRWRKRRWWHAARLPEPSCCYRLRHSCANRRILAPLPRCNRHPEPPPVLTSRYPRPPRRSQQVSPRTLRPPVPYAHRNPLRSGVATTT